MSAIETIADSVGQLETLDDLSKAVNYNKWIFDLMKPHLGDRVLEVGCGTGNIIQHLSDKCVLGIDIEKKYLDIARRKFKKQKKISFKLFDLSRGLKPFKNFKPDTIICINVLEHIEKDDRFLSECQMLLPKGGKLLLFVPALPAIFGEMDKTYGHFRRYTKTQIIRKLSAGFEVEKCEYWNLTGILGWWVNGKLFKRKIIPQKQILIYDKILKYILWVEKIMPKPVGLSVFAVARK